MEKNKRINQSEKMGNPAHRIRLKKIAADPNICIWGDCLNQQINKYLCQVHQDEFNDLDESRDRVEMHRFFRRGMMSPNSYANLLEK